MTADAPGPLSHLRVLDFTALLQGPLATQILGDLGAGVVKIERVEGEWSRHWGILDGHTHGHRGVPDLGAHTGEIFGQEDG